MKYIILTITFCALFFGAKAQETIELDGVKIKKSILKPGREVKLNAKEYKTNGKHWIMHMVNLSHEVHLSTNSLLVFNDQGEIVLEVDSLADMRVSASKDLICYKIKTDLNDYSDQINEFYCYDLIKNKVWKKTFKEKVYVDPASLNGDYLIANSGGFYILFDRKGNQRFKIPVSALKSGGFNISNDGKYGISNISSTKDTSYFEIYSIPSMKQVNKVKYAEVEPADYKLYNGEAFVNRSKYIVALTSIIAPYTAMIVFHDIDGTYLGHEVYENIKSSFSGPDITLQNDGSFEVYVDGNYLGNLVLPNVNTLKYLKK
jgi:hypothetical protein